MPFIARWQGLRQALIWQLRLNSTLAVILLGALLAIASCTDTGSLLEREHDLLEDENSALLHVESYTSSGATGDCSSTVVERWYGSQTGVKELQDRFEGRLAERGYSLPAQGVTESWHKATGNHRFVVVVTAFSTTAEIDRNRGYYQLPDNVLSELEGYQTSYVVTLSHMTKSAAARCFQQ